MQTYMFAAGILALVVGAIHSVFGEILIFRHLRSSGLVPTMEAPPLRQRHVRIIWASWHLVTVFGWALGAVLLRFAFPSDEQSIQIFTENAIVCASLAGSLLVLIGTKGRHPGWIGLLGIAVLIWFN
ncbi:MAG: hypothetical protein V4812_21715 [Pseudomonadota bacterium]